MIDREDKFYVFKKEEMDSVLNKNPLLDQYFNTIVTLVRLERIAHNKRPVNEYVTCNQDEPYAENVWKIILDGEEKKKFRGVKNG